MIQLVIVQQTRLLCELFAAVLREELDIQIVGCAVSVKEAMAQIADKNCNVVLIGLNMPHGDGLGLVRTLRKGKHDVKILLTGLINSRQEILRCVEEGADGYILEDDAVADMVKKIHAVHANEFLVSPAVAAALMSHIVQLKALVKTTYGVNARRTDELLGTLTPRECEVLRLIADGANNQQIADKLVIEHGTAKNHVHNILSKLDVHSRDHAATLAHRLFAEQFEEPSKQVEPVQTFPAFNFPIAATNCQQEAEDGHRQHDYALS